VLLLAILAGAACQHRPLADPLTATASAQLRVRLPPLRSARWRDVSVWMSRPRSRPRRPLVLHLTGDSGYHGLDLELFGAVTGWGYPVAVLASPDWIGTLPTGVATRESLARDLDAIARAAARSTGVPEDERVVLLGLSRGADLVLEASADPSLQARWLGVVALGLTPREEYVVSAEGEGRPYRDKDRLPPGLPLEVIQSTSDRYMSAAAAREAFGPDSDRHTLHPIVARSHTFVDGRDALLAQLRRSLERVAAPRARAESASPVAAAASRRPR